MTATAVWTVKEETSLLEFLLDHRAEAGDGCNFKQTTMQHAAEHIKPLHVRGGPKTYKTCQNKFGAFRKLYRIIRAIQAVSGWTWSDETGASITPDSASSWDDYVRRHPEAKPFRNKGWVHFPKMEMLMPSTVRGANVYHASSAIAEADNNDMDSSSSSSDDDTTPEASQNDPHNESPALEDASMPSSTVSNKRQRAPATPTKADVKRVRASGSSALMSIAESLSAFNSTLATSLAPPTSGDDLSSIRRREAITQALTLEKNWLTVAQRARLVDFLSSDLSAVDVYMAIEETDVRQEWVRMQLGRLGEIVSA